MLERAAAQATGTPAGPLVAEALDQGRQGLAELRELAHGIRPAVLSGRGLAATLAGLVARPPLPVELRVSHERAAPTVEAAIYSAPVAATSASGPPWPGGAADPLRRCTARFPAMELAGTRAAAFIK